MLALSPVEDSDMPTQQKIITCVWQKNENKNKNWTHKMKTNSKSQLPPY